MCFFCVRSTTPVGVKTVTKIYTFCERDGQSPFLSLFHKLDRKLQQKILKGLRCKVLYPSYRTQPHVKHFTIERYSGLYEYRERIRVLFRVIYMVDSKQNIILLAPFIKRRDKDTQYALELAIQRAVIIRQYPECRVELDLGGETPVLIHRDI